jgi:hypothetical protein
VLVLIGLMWLRTETSGGLLYARYESSDSITFLIAQPAASAVDISSLILVDSVRDSHHEWLNCGKGIYNIDTDSGTYICY